MATPSLNLNLPDISAENIIKPETLLPQRAIKDVDRLVKASNRILFEPRQESVVESVVADLYDVVIGVIPFIGDAIGNGPRVAVAQSRNDEEAALFHGIDLGIGVIPFIGDVGNILIPANTILQVRTSAKCISDNVKNPKELMKCLTSDDSLEQVVKDHITGIPETAKEIANKFKPRK